LVKEDLLQNSTDLNPAEITFILLRRADIPDQLELLGSQLGGFIYQYLGSGLPSQYLFRFTDSLGKNCRPAHHNRNLTAYFSGPGKNNRYLQDGIIELGQGKLFIGGTGVLREGGER